MILSDVKILKEVRSECSGFEIEPFHKDNVQPASYDLTLADEFLTRSESEIPLEVTEKPKYAKTIPLLKPKEFLLASTVEKITLPNGICGRVEGRSSIGRLGLFIHNAGWIDSGFSGQITLELFNASKTPIKLVPGMKICQAIFTRAHRSKNLYDGKYQNQKGTTGSKIEQDFS